MWDSNTSDDEAIRQEGLALTELTNSVSVVAQVRTLRHALEALQVEVKIIPLFYWGES